MTPSSTAAVPADDRPTDDENCPLPTHGLQNVFAGTILSGSDDENEEVEFSYGTEPLPCSLPPQAGPHGFPGDALVSPL